MTTEEKQEGGGGALEKVPATPAESQAKEDKNETPDAKQECDDKDKEESHQQPAPSTTAPAIASPPSLAPLQAPTFEDDGTFALPPGETFKTITPSSSTTPTTATATPNNPANSKGAQILMSRFSTWGKLANENATILWKQAKEAQEKAAATNQGPLAVLRQATVGVTSVRVGRGGSNDDDDDDDYEDSSRSCSDEDGDMDRNEDDNERVVVEEEQESGSDAPTSTRSMPNLPTRREMRSNIQHLATGALDSVATGFRGRYAANTGHDDLANTNATPKSTTPISPTTAARESQTALILKSRAAAHLQEILDSLEPFQYVLLLGAGRLQVNLKNPYVKHQGTYVDFLVRGGAADKSGVVAVGDSIVKVGPQDVRKHTIADVPSIIAQAKRPVVLVLTTGIELDVERISYLDLAVAMMHQIRAKDEQQKLEMIASAHKNKEKEIKETDHKGKDEEISSTNESTKEHEEKSKEERSDEKQTDEEIPSKPKEEEKTESEADKEAAFDNIEIPAIRSIEDYASTPQPPSKARLAYKHLVGKRCNDNFNVTQFSQVAASDDNFRAVIRNAFLCCAVDGRRFPFLGRHLTMEQDMLDNNSQKQSTSPQLQQPNKNAPNALLMLFLELLNYADLHGVTPVTLRRNVAQRIAYKFFLPTKVKAGLTGAMRLENPIFDFHNIVSDTVLRQLEATLNNTQTGVPQDLFLDFQHAVVDALCGTTFLLFLVSNHCARMRAYLRNVAPFVNVPLMPVFDALTGKANHGGDDAASAGLTKIHSGAKNYFLYVLIYLMQLEKDPTATLSTDDSTLLGRNGHRMVGAAGGLCCYLFIGRVVIPALEKFQHEPSTQKSEACEAKINDDETTSETSNDASKSSEPNLLVDAVGQLWEVFVAPGVGALEHTWKSKETKEHLESLRSLLRAIRKDVLGGSTSNSEESRVLLFAQGFASDPKLKQQLRDLADYLLYDYAIHTHSQFREHIFHEWMCNELVKAKKDHGKQMSEAEEKDETKQQESSQLPDLPSGCIKRLLRKVELPVGVSPHKPIHSNHPVSEKRLETGSPNADCAVVFGTSVGPDLAVQMMSPAMDQSDIRRYTCQDVTISGEKLPEAFEEEMIPPTLESYAVLPPSRATGFAEVTGNVSLSSDGWEVSMINFMIPKADDGSGEEQDRALYGVSLVFQRSSTARFYPRRISQTQLVGGDAATRTGQVEEKKAETTADKDATKAFIDDGREYPSPLSFDTPADNHWSTFTRNIKVSEETPTFNSHLREQAWVDRVLQDEMRDQDVPATVGIALVSRRNVVIAMRQTLWMLLRDFSRMPDDDKASMNRSNDTVITCGSLVDLLGNFAHQDVEGIALRCILEPYIRAASSSWIERPLSSQKEEFERLAGQQLITCLPPIPLALLFVAALLEQKIILSSSRRSILFSATAALTGMLKPLKWCHLLVPLVPEALAKDLIQYPAPYILGIPSESHVAMEILRDLPMDVTLVDLDVGRVILAPQFSFDSTNFTGLGHQDPSQTMSALRSQVLYLAQILGSHFGAKLFRDAWSCDNPSLILRNDSQLTGKEADYDVLRSLCRRFIDELMAGVSSSCFWIEEEPSPDKKGHSTSTDPTVLFDEDRFFQIKRWREENGFEPLLRDADLSANRNLALSMDGFNLVLETFVRCQSMNWYLSSQPKHKMACFL